MDSLRRRCLSSSVHKVSLSGTRKLPRKLKLANFGARRSQSSSTSPKDTIRSKVNPWIAWPTTIVVLVGAGVVAYETYQPFRHTVLAVVRCSRIGGVYIVLSVLLLFILWDTSEAAVLGAFDYKKTLSKTYETEEEQEQAYSDCHRRSAHRVLKALLANGGMSYVFNIEAEDLCYDIQEYL